MKLIFHENPMTNMDAYLVCATILFTLLILGYIKVKSLIKKEDFYRLYFPIIIGSIIIAVIPVFSKLGWPNNHDGILWKHRIDTYVMHLSQFDIFPIWCARDGHSMGSPDSLFYHKLFYYVAAFFYILTAKIKLAIVLSVGTFMFIGTWGVYRISSFLGTKNWTSLILAICFLFLNYTLTNWLLRGAMAEFSAMVFVPLLFLEELKLIQTKRYSHWLGITLLLLYLSHSIIGYYAIFTVVFTLIFTITKASKQEIIRLLKKISLSALSIIGIVLIYLIPMLVLMENYDSSTIKSGEMTPFYKMVNFSRYFYDTQYKWFTEPYWDLSVQFDLPVLSIMLIALGFVLYRVKQIKISSVNKKAIGLLVVANAFFIYLQTRPSLWFYDLFPGASFIQFPWRLLTFIQVLNLVILVWLLGRMEQLKMKKAVLILPIVLLGCLFFRYPAFYGSMEKWFPEEAMEKPYNDYCSNGEFLPQMYGQEFKSLNQCMFMLQRNGIKFDKQENTMKMIDKDAIHLEKLNVEFEADIKNPSEVILPFSYSKLTRLFRVDSIDGKVQIPIYRNDSDPRVRAFLPFGKYTVILKQPTLASFLILKKPKTNLPEYKEEIVCEADHLTENSSRLRSTCGQYIFKHFNNQSNEEAHSGEYSLKLDKNNPYGFTHIFTLKKDYYCDWEVSAWRKGGDAGFLHVSFDDSGVESVGNNTAVETDSLGWQLVKVKFRIPKQVEENDIITVYTYIDNHDQTIYFDDLRIKKL